MRIALQLLLGVLAGFALSVQAAVITTVGAGSAVDTVFRQAQFTGISGSLLNYTEGGLIVSVDDTHCCFGNAHYGNGGNNSFVTITTPEGLNFGALEFDFGTGFASGLHSVVWETWRDGSMTGSGVLTNVFASTGLASGFTVLGWSDVNLFDELRVGAAPMSNGYTTFGQFQAIALDNVKIDLTGPNAAPVPAPGVLLLLALGLLGVTLFRRRTA
jgi:hypothetical protein